MVRRRYAGVSLPEKEFQALYPAYQALMRMQVACTPFGPDYLVLMEAKDALRRAAQHFTGDAHIYGLSSERPLG